ncbi:MAG: DUF420 domain-containing protein [Planctomycetota bacterium]|nr:MAG: DUF420 domain-containing protein [Planctomycetota bacterium]
MWQHGFLGYDTSFMLDVVVSALVLLVPGLAAGIFAAKRGRYRLHRNIQLTLACVLLIAVMAFEVDLQWVHGGWEKVVNKDPHHPRLTAAQLESVRRVLWLHLVFAISTPPLWATTIVLALRRFPNPPAPAEHSLLHRRLGWVSTIDLVLTSATGLWFYVAAFVR